MLLVTSECKVFYVAHAGPQQVVLELWCGLNEILADIEGVADKHWEWTMPLTEYWPISSAPVTMSDRASTEKSFNDLQTAYHAELLPTVVDN